MGFKSFRLLCFELLVNKLNNVATEAEDHQADRWALNTAYLNKEQDLTYKETTVETGSLLLKQRRPN